jgi:hypothetical protein
MDLGDLRQMLVDWASRIVRFTSIATAGSDTSCTVAGRSYAGGPPEPGIRARLMFPFGIRSVPPSGVDAAVVHPAGASARGIVVGCDSKAFGPADLAEGETAIYSKVDGVVVKLDASGLVLLGAASGTQRLPHWETFCADLAAALPEIVAGLGAIGFASTNTAQLLARLAQATPGNPYKSDVVENA